MMGVDWRQSLVRELQLRGLTAQFQVLSLSNDCVLGMALGPLVRKGCRTQSPLASRQQSKRPSWGTTSSQPGDTHQSQSCKTTYRGLIEG